MTDPAVEFMQLQGARLLLRPCRLDDAEQYFEAAVEARKAMGPGVSWANDFESRQDAEQRIQEAEDKWRAGSSRHFGVFDAASSKFLGGCGLNGISQYHKFANLGYWVRPSENGKGIAPEATRLVAWFGLETLGLNRIEIVAAVENKRSQRVAEKAGATREGIARSRLIVNGVACDAVVYSLVADDFR